MSETEIRVAIPPQTRFVALCRIAAASLAAELDVSVDEIDDLTVGANELVAILVDWAEDHGADEIELVYRIDDETLTIEGRVVGAGDGPADSDPLAERILAAVVDEYSLGAGSGRIVKRRA